MGHGWPDYKKISAMKTVHPIFDVGEAAVRLGSIVTFDRRGDVIFLDSFEDGMDKWEKNEVGTGAEIHLSAATARSGAYSCRILTSATNNELSFIRKFLFFPVISKVGVEFSYAASASDVQIMLTVNARSGGKMRRFHIKYNEDEQTFYYRDSTGTWVSLSPTCWMKSYEKYFHTIKLVFDLETTKYVRLLADDGEYDLSDKSGEEVTDTDFPYTGIGIHAATRSAAQRKVWIDDFILTQNEPA